ncbi:MAG: 1-deoxy-D-xylulose-5-phosphate reductoisomerase [Chitinophagaceae bacterium]|nr:1-deoxy-D-xylulose-5-phosphate reductoisomerase [Chitinophagaceae bacterium]
MKKRIAIFGSTGSIGTQTLEVIATQQEFISAEILTAHSNEKLLIEQALKYKPAIVVIGDEKKFNHVNEILSPHDIKVFAGEKALIEIAASDTYDILVAAIVGFAGLQSTLAAVEQGKIIALANKETLVVAGDIVMASAQKFGATILPVDSEHCAIFQCLQGEQKNSIEKVILTASGGPFLGRKQNYLINVKKEHALQHPTWTMGAKISIDSATLMNKGLEMIEAKWLFGLDVSQIEVVIHPQSIIHSMVQFVDGSVKAQMGLPSMKHPIQYALSYPTRIPADIPRMNFGKDTSLTMEAPDYKTFKNLSLAIDALKIGGNAPCVLNAANEIAVDAFLKNKIGFLEMSQVIEKTLEYIPFISKPSLHNYIETNNESRIYASELIQNY